MRKIKIVYLLDRNAVSCIKDSVQGKKAPIDRLYRLRQIDRKNNFISPILSIIEGQSGKKEDKEGIINTLQKETKAVESFFQLARTDSDYLRAGQEQVAETFSGKIEESWNDYISLIKSSHSLLYQPVAKSKKQQYENEIMALAASNNVPLGHPVNICCLAVLYGNEEARKVLKPKKNTSAEELDLLAYNAASDLLLPSRIAHIRAISEKLGEAIRYKLLSFDKSLNGFASSIATTEATPLPSGGVKITANYSRSLFPELDGDEYVALIRRLQLNA